MTRHIPIRWTLSARCHTDVNQLGPSNNKQATHFFFNQTDEASSKVKQLFFFILYMST